MRLRFATARTVVVLALELALCLSGRAESKAYPDIKGPIAVWVSYFGELGFVEAGDNGSLFSTPIQWDIGDLMGWCCGIFAIAGHPRNRNILYVSVSDAVEPNLDWKTDLYTLDLSTGDWTWILEYVGRSSSLGSDCDGFLYSTSYIPGGPSYFHEIEPKTSNIVSTSPAPYGHSRDFTWTPTSMSLNGELWSTRSSGVNPPYLKLVHFDTGVEYFDTSKVGYLEGLAMDLRVMAPNPSGLTTLIAMDHHGNLFQVSGEQPGDQNWIDLGLEVGGSDLANIPGFCSEINSADPNPGPGGDDSGG